MAHLHLWPTPSFNTRIFALYLSGNIMSGATIQRLQPLKVSGTILTIHYKVHYKVTTNWYSFTPQKIHTTL
jgi:hypothetical protein